MKRLIKLFICSSLFLMCAFCISAVLFSNNKTATTCVNAAEIPSTPGIVSFNEKYGENNNDLISYLSINISNSGVSNIKIQQTIGNMTFDITNDESGRIISSNSGNTYLFTRTATYLVSYRYGETDYQMSYAFTPHINTTLLNSSAVKYINDANGSEFSIQFIGGKYYLVGNGYNDYTLGIYYNTSLYNLMLNSTAVIAPTSSLYHELPVAENTYGVTNIIFKSKNGFSSKAFSINIINPQYLISYSGNGFNAENLSSKQMGINEHGYADYYIFNEGIQYQITLASNVADPITGEIINSTDKLNCLNELEFKVLETEQKANNTGSIATRTNKLIYNSASNLFEKGFLKTDHTIFKISSCLKSGDPETQQLNVNTNISNFKIITKVPYYETATNVYSFGIYLNDNLATELQTPSVDYLNAYLNGYIENGTIIYTANSGAIIDNNILSLYYSINNSVITHSSANLSNLWFGHGNSIDITLQNLPHNTNAICSNFEKLFSFDFTMCYMNSTSGDYFTKYINVSDSSNNALSTSNVNNVTSAKITTASNYETNCLPIYIKVNYNGKEYENLHTFSNSDQLSFTDYGEYEVELYIFPSSQYALSFIQNVSGKSQYYVKYNFVINGPSILVTSTDYNGNEFSVTNYMYTQNSSICHININEDEGQKIIITNKTANKTYEYNQEKRFPDEGVLINVPATYSIAVYASDGTVLKYLEYTMLDSTYQGYTINNHTEYEELVLYKYNETTKTYDELDDAISYHLLEEGQYRIKIVNGEKLYFNLNGNTTNASNEITNYLSFTIKKSFFSITFSTGVSGDRITDDVEIKDYNGVEIQQIIIYRNGKQISVYEPTGSTSIGNLVNSDLKFSETGLYTIRLVDKYGNFYEAQIEKYYKANIALIFLLIIGAAAVFTLGYWVFRSRRGIKVK